MIIVVSPMFDRADKWARSQDPPVNLRGPSVKIFLTNEPPYARRARMLTADDTIVWISGWGEGKWATTVADALIPCVGRATEIHT